MRDLKAIAARVREALGKDWRVDACLSGDAINIRPEYERAAEVTFDTLAAISSACETRLIDLTWDPGWGGSDVTPGDPASLMIRVRW